MGGQRMDRCVRAKARESHQSWEFAKGSFSLLQWLILLRWGWEHFIPAHQRLSFQLPFRQDWNKMSLMNHTTHSISTSTPWHFQP